MIVYRYKNFVYCHRCGRYLIDALTSLGEAPPDVPDQLQFPAPERVESLDTHCAAGIYCDHATRNSRGAVVGRYLGVPSN